MLGMCGASMVTWLTIADVVVLGRGGLTGLWDVVEGEELGGGAVESEL